MSDRGLTEVAFGWTGVPKRVQLRPMAFRLAPGLGGLTATNDARKA